MKILFLKKTPDATATYRCDIPAKYLNLAGHETRTQYLEKFKELPGSGIREEDVEWADVVIFQRPITPPAIHCLREVKKKCPDKLVVGDYDDDYTSVPEWNPGYPFLKMYSKEWREGPPLYDLIMSSTQPLKERMQLLAPNVPGVVMPNGFDFQVFDNLAPMVPVEMSAPNPKTGKLDIIYRITSADFNEITRDKTVVCWAGSKFHYADLDWMTADFLKLAKQRSDIVFVFVGFCTGNIVQSLPLNRLFLVKGFPTTALFYSFLKSIHVDIGLAPLHPCVFNSSKSNLKLLESWALNWFPVMSQWDPYFEIDDEEETFGTSVGYQSGDWGRAISSAADFLKDKENKRMAAEANNAFCRKNYDAAVISKKYIEVFEQHLKEKRR